MRKRLKKPRTRVNDSIFLSKRCYVILMVLMVITFVLLVDMSTDQINHQFKFIIENYPFIHDNSYMANNLTELQYLTVDIITNATETAAVKEIPEQRPGRYAYVTLISGIDSTLKYRGFFYNTLLMRKSLKEHGSTADFIVMLGFDDKNTSFFDNDADLLRSYDIKIYVLPRFVDDSHGLSFAEMALLKITPWSFTEYERVQFFDGDIFPTDNMDCFFHLNQNTFTIGAASPLNSGWYLAIPNRDHFIELRRKALWRLGRDWNKETGWSNRLPSDNSLFYRGGKKACLLWDFNGADMDQGLLTDYYVLTHGGVLLVDTDTQICRMFKKGLLTSKDDRIEINEALSCCKGRIPTSFFLHFTGQSKPWVKESTSRGPSGSLWWSKFRSLNLSVSDCVFHGDCKSPLGYWNRDFPKGGFKIIPEDQLAEYRIW